MSALWANTVTDKLQWEQVQGEAYLYKRMEVAWVLVELDVHSL
jgi:hypothetical protein